MRVTEQTFAVRAEAREHDDDYKAVVVITPNDSAEIYAWGGIYDTRQRALNAARDAMGEAAAALRRVHPGVNIVLA